MLRQATAGAAQARQRQRRPSLSQAFRAACRLNLHWFHNWLLLLMPLLLVLVLSLLAMTLYPLLRTRH